MEIKVNFLDKLRLEAKFDDFTVVADQPIRYKGDGSAPGPFDYFLASSALCAAYFVKLYCNTRDIPTDAVVQKRTLAVRLGRSAMNTVYALELLLPFVLLPWFAVQTNLAWRMTWPVIAGVLAVTLYRRFCAAQGAAFNALLAATAQLQWVFAVLLMGALLFP